MVTGDGSNVVLVVAAHPDDEVLGCGGTIARHSAAGDEVHILFLADGVGARGERVGSLVDARMHAAQEAARLLGAQTPRFLSLPDNRLDSLHLLDLIQQVEAVVTEVCPRVVYTHHGGDLNIDHRLAHQAVLTVCRPLPGCSVEALYAFEVLSSSEWALSAGEFHPTRYVNVERYLGKKLEAVAAYAAEMRPFPHARSVEMVEAQARLRGGSIGVAAAEAFEVVRERVV